MEQAALGRSKSAGGRVEGKGVDLCKDRAKSTWRVRADMKQFLQWGMMGKCQGTGAVFLHHKSGENYVCLIMRFMGRNNTMFNALESFLKIY